MKELNNCLIKAALSGRRLNYNHDFLHDVVAIKNKIRKLAQKGFPIRICQMSQSNLSVWWQAA